MDAALQEELECPICLEIMLGKISLCNNGHNMCKKCKGKLRQQNCPVCKASFINGRNYALEKIAKNFTFNCRNKGCHKEFKANLISEHNDKCIYKIEQCPLSFKGCSWKGIFFHIKQHVKIQHKKKLNEWLKYDSNMDYYIFLTFNSGDLFIAHVKTESSNKICAVMKMGLNEKFSADNFKFSYALEGGGYKAINVAPCIPRCNKDQIYNSEYVTISEEMLKKLKKNNDCTKDILIENTLYSKTHD